MEQKQYWTGDESQYMYHSIEDFVKCFRAYSVPQIVEDNHCTENGSKQAVQAGDSFRISKWKIFKVCLSREVLLLKKNYPVHIFKVIQIMFLASVTATLFFRSEMNQDTVLDGVKYLGALFMGVIVINFNCTIELGMVTKRLPIFYKQSELLELPGWPIVCTVFVTSLPVSLMQSGLWTFSTYYAIGQLVMHLLQSGMALGNLNTKNTPSSHKKAFIWTLIYFPKSNFGYYCYDMGFSRCKHDVEAYLPSQRGSGQQFILSTLSWFPNNDSRFIYHWTPNKNI
jgi:hypothetical protein